MAPPAMICPVTSADLPSLSALVHASKLTLTINRLLYHDWPNDAAQRPQYTAAVESSFKDPNAECLKAVDETGEIRGYVVLTRRRPVCASEGQRAAETETEIENSEGTAKQQSVPAGMNATVLAAVGAAAAELAQQTAGVDHLEVTFIVVAPSSRRKGIGSQFMQVGLERAKAAGIALAVTAEPASYDFFAKLGFKETKHVDLDLAKWAPKYSGFGLFRLAAMIWKP